MAYRSLEDALTIGWGIERQFRCFVHGDSNASASVNALTGLWVCYACGARGKVDMDRIDYDVRAVVKHTEIVAQAVEAAHTPDLRYTESWLDVFDAGGPGGYWLSRFSAVTCQDFRFGQGPGVATYPLRDNVGKVMGIVTRDLTGTRDEKYKYPRGAATSDYLADYHRLTSDDVFLVEGISDVAAIHDAGYFGFAVGAYGSNYSAKQAALMRQHAPERVLVLFDQDAAGHNGAEQVAHRHQFDFPVRRITWDHYKDVAEMPMDTRRAFLKTALDLHVRSS